MSNSNVNGRAFSGELLFDGDLSGVDSVVAAHGIEGVGAAHQELAVSVSGKSGSAETLVLARPGHHQHADVVLAFVLKTEDIEKGAYSGL